MRFDSPPKCEEGHPGRRNPSSWTFSTPDNAFTSVTVASGDVFTTNYTGTNHLYYDEMDLGLTAPREATASYLIGDAHVNAGRDGPASASYRRALAMAPGHRQHSPIA